MNKHALLVPMTLAALSWAAPRAARADFTTTVDVTKCKGTIPKEDGFLSRTTAGKLTAKGGDVTVVCPIAKTTSVPGATNDYFVSAKVPIETTGGLQVSCETNVWRAHVVDGQTSNLVKRWTGSSTSTGTITMASTAAARGPVRFWDAGGTGDSWYYTDVVCTLPMGTSIKNFPYIEGGTTQANYRIFPGFATCAADASNRASYQYRDASPGNSVGGFLMGQANGMAPFLVNCPLTNARTVEIAIGPRLGGYSANDMGCDPDAANWSSRYWDIGSDSEWPSFIPAPIDYHVLGVPLTGTHQLVCGVNDSLGDGKVLSYRTLPYPTRTTWHASSPLGGTPANVLDNNAGTRWTTGRAGRVGDSITVDMGSSRTVQQVAFDSGSSSNDFARGYEISASEDGVNFYSVTTGTGTGPYVSARFSEQWVRAVRITLTQASTKYWSIHELNVY